MQPYQAMMWFFARNKYKTKETSLYRFAESSFNHIYKWFNTEKIHLSNDAPNYRLISKRVINFIMQHTQPAVAYRYLPATSGFNMSYINYSHAPTLHRTKTLKHSITKGIKLMVSTTTIPMRLATFLCLFGATVNILYSTYVLLIAIFSDNVATGWISMSLQVSGMFFLISLVLAILSEYILYIADLRNERPHYYISQELTSAKITRINKLNIEEEQSTEA